MELIVGTTVNKRPGADDVARAIDGAAASDFSITLDAGNRGSLDAYARGGGGFSVVAATTSGTYRSAKPVDADTLKRAFTKYLKGDASWRSECQWTDTEASDAEDDATSPEPATEQPAAMAPAEAAKAPDRPHRPPPAMAVAPAKRLTPHNPSKLPTWALGIIAASIGFVIICFEFKSVARLLPYSDSDYFWIGLIFFPIFVAVIVAITATKIETRAARSWASAPGTIVKSRVAQSRHQFSGDATTVTNVPDIEYEFTANGRTFRGNRVSVAEDSGGPNLEATMKRYPAGSPVTVYYDPADPAHCALERDMPKDLAKGCAAAILILVVLAGGAYLFGREALQWLEARKIDNAPFVLAITGFGLVMLLFAYVMRKAAKAAMSWPSVKGQIVSSEVEQYEKYEDGRSRTNYRPAVEFSYTVNGGAYRSRQIQLNVTTTGGKGYAEKVVARYPRGASVDVHYDPQNPSTAALENPTGMYWLIVVGAVVCFAIAAFAAGLFK